MDQCHGPLGHPTSLGQVEVRIRCKIMVTKQTTNGNVHNQSFMWYNKENGTPSTGTANRMHPGSFEFAS